MSIEQTANRFAPYVLSILRLVLGLVLLQHPLSKFMAFPMQMNAQAMFSLYWWAGVIEIVFGVLLAVQPAAGLLTIVWLIGAYAVVVGVAMNALNTKLRSIGQPTDHSTAGSPQAA